MRDRFVHRFIPAREPGAATLLVLHGSGGNEHALVPLAQTVDDRSAILSPRGRILENGDARFFRRFAEGVFDQADLRAQTDALAEFVAAAAVGYGFDAARVYALGYSNGANIAASLLLSRPEVLAGAFLFRVILPFEPEVLPALPGTHAFISAGRQDPLMPSASTERLAALLEASGASVKVLWQETGHALTPADVREARRWWRAIRRE